MLFSFKPAKPIAPALVLPPDDTKFYKHQGENPAQYQEFRTRVAWLNEMLKYFPTFEQSAIAGFGDILDPEPGMAVGLTPYEGPMSEDGIGEWADDIAGRGWEWRNRVDGSNEARYGDYHRLAQYYGGESGAIYWGYGEGAKGHQDNNYHPASYETYEGLENLLVDVGQYQTYLFEENNDSDLSNDISLSDITQGEWSDVQSYLQGLGNFSFYQLALKGADTIDFAGDYLNDGHTPNNVGYLYKGGGAQEALYMMMALLESRRKIFFAMADLFAPHWYRADVNLNSAIMDWVGDVMDVRFGGVDDQNKGALLKYFQLQHAFHSIYASFCYDDTSVGDVNDWVFSARDKVALKEMRDWIHTGVQDYIDNIDPADVDELNKIQNLFNEFKYDPSMPQPYGQDGREAGQQAYSGWDYVLPGHDANNARYTDATVPGWVNPANTPDADYHHWNFATSQIYGMNESQIMGRTRFEYGGLSYNLYTTNSMVNIIGRLLRTQQIGTKRMIEASAINSYNKTIYRRQKRAYKRAVEAEKEAKYEEAMDLRYYHKKKAEAARDRKRAAQKSRGGRPRAKAKKPEKTFAEAMRESNIRMMTKSVTRSVQKMRELRKASLARSRKLNQAQKKRA